MKIARKFKIIHNLGKVGVQKNKEGSRMEGTLDFDSVDLGGSF